MKRLRIGLIVAALVCASAATVRAADAGDPNAILDKAIQALGGAEKLEKVKALTWTSKGALSFGGADNPVTMRTTAQGLDHARQEVDVEFGGMQHTGKTLIAGDKGSREFDGNKMELDKDGVADAKRDAYLAQLPINPLPLKGKEYKLEALAGEKIDDKPVAGLKVTPPDGKEFRIYFDADSGLPVKVAAKIKDFNGAEVAEEVTFSEYKEMEGIKKATHVTSRREGEKFMDLQVAEFKVLAQVDPKTFEE